MSAGFAVESGGIELLLKLGAPVPSRGIKS